MIRFLVKRVLLTVPTFVALIFLVFVAIRLVPGDPVEVRVGEHGIDPARLAMLRHQLGLDLPVWQQFLVYLGQLAHGDFGRSLSTSNPVLGEFLTLFPATLELAASAMVIAVVVGLPLGVLAAVKRGSVVDQGLWGCRSRAIPCRSSGGDCCSSCCWRSAGISCPSGGAST